MSKVFHKETSLLVVFVENGIEGKHNMLKVMELLGAPKSKVEYIERGWDITAPNGKTIRVYSSEVKDFILGTTFSTAIGVLETEYPYSSYANKRFIQEHIFNDPSNAELYSEIDAVYSGSIGVNTVGTDTTRTKVSQLHRKNVLALKDKIVAMEHVHNVEYTCEWKRTEESECSV